MTKQQILDCPIIQCEKISSDVYLIILQAPDGKVFDYKAGQYLFINMGEDDARPYSIASAVADGRTLEMHIKDIPNNDFTAQVLQRLKSEDHISVRLPAGSCTLEQSSGNSPLLFISGGTGFAHSHSIIKTLLAADDSRPIYLYWGANQLDEIYLYDSPSNWMAEHDRFHFVPVINNTDPKWTGERGMVHEAVFRNIPNLQDFDIYLSGSSAMVFNIYRQLKEKQVSSTRIFSDMLDILRDKEELD